MILRLMNKNALVERVTGIMKDEFMLGEMLSGYELACKMVSEVVNIDNDKRPHQSLGYKNRSVRHAA